MSQITVKKLYFLPVFDQIYSTHIHDTHINAFVEYKLMLVAQEKQTKISWAPELFIIPMKVSFYHLVP